MPRPGQVLAGISVLSLAVLCYISGAAAIYFDGPSSDALGKAFRGARAWWQRTESALAARPPLEADLTVVSVDKVDKTYDGFTLYTTTEKSEATLIDMADNVVHRWQMPFSKAFPKAKHVAPGFDDDHIHWFRSYLYPNGDLLAIYHADGDTPYGYGLVKLDRDSNLLWTYAANVHHDLDVGEDGRIYTLTQQLVHQPPAGLESVPSPYIADNLVVLTPNGKVLEEIPILEAFRDSAYSVALESVYKRGKRTSAMPLPPPGAGGANTPGRPMPPPPPGTSGQAPPPPGQPGTPNPAADDGDILHTNSVRVLPASIASSFPQFKAGQVLISLRRLNAVAVVDVPTKSVVWSAGGIWHSQHDVEFLNNGNLLLYDNLGSPLGSRVLEYDPKTQALPWAYSSEQTPAFVAINRGMKQRLPNGNTLIVDPDGKSLYEVTRQKELVWSSSCVTPQRQEEGTRRLASLTGARRYGPNDLTFLNEGQRPRP
jgi:hypothetical protein